MTQVETNTMSGAGQKKRPALGSSVELTHHIRDLWRDRAMEIVRETDPELADELDTALTAVNSRLVGIVEVASRQY